MRIISKFFSLVLLFAILGGGLVATVYLFPDEVTPYSGMATASDGDSIRIGNQRLRLLGIDAPELEQSCTTNQGEIWPCGRQSKDYLNQLLSTGEIDCRSEKQDKYGRALAVCEINNLDIGAIMVTRGLAVSNDDYSQEEALAKARKVGLWSGQFISPRAWRDGVRQQSSDYNWFDWLWDQLFN